MSAYAVAIAPACVAAAVGAAVTSAVVVACAAGAATAVLALTAAIVGRDETSRDVHRALRAALGALAVRVLGGLVLVGLAAWLMPAHAALVAGVAGAGLAGAALVQAVILVSRRETTRG